jgi:hypothetical protein
MKKTSVITEIQVTNSVLINGEFEVKKGAELMIKARN